ncbi:hypothetical protein MSPP1_003334 [Malassezia sp. CBS 17886]|nr:hypothetical protein MSPP1_003334 [Malassezia sp. CBS 17886]
MSAERAEFVYALYNFDAENPDEVSFKVGERVLVVEKDDAYGDGWYQGTNVRGDTGLFPFSYTTSEEESAKLMASSVGAAGGAPAADAGGVPVSAASPGGAPVAGVSPYGARASAASPGGAPVSAVPPGVMHSTMADIDNAITELHGRDGGRARSPGSQTEADADDDEADGEHDFAARAVARAELAKNAQKALAAQDDDMLDTHDRSLGAVKHIGFSTAPGITPLALLEMSDESEDDVDEPRAARLGAAHTGPVGLGVGVPPDARETTAAADDAARPTIGGGGMGAAGMSVPGGLDADTDAYPVEVADSARDTAAWSVPAWPTGVSPAQRAEASFPSPTAGRAPMSPPAPPAETSAVQPKDTPTVLYSGMAAAPSTDRAPAEPSAPGATANLRDAAWGPRNTAGAAAQRADASPSDGAQRGWAAEAAAAAETGMPTATLPGSFVSEDDVLGDEFGRTADEVGGGRGVAAPPAAQWENQGAWEEPAHDARPATDYGTGAHSASPGAPRPVPSASAAQRTVSPASGAAHTVPPAWDAARTVSPTSAPSGAAPPASDAPRTVPPASAAPRTAPPPHGLGLRAGGAHAPSPTAVPAALSMGNLAATPPLSGPPSGLASPASGAGLFAGPGPGAGVGTMPAGNPATWSVDEVTAWAQYKGYDRPTIDKLVEHEISGDALLAMDVNLLKEIDIHAFGRRFHLANGIRELRALASGTALPPPADVGAAPLTKSPTSPMLASVMSAGMYSTQTTPVLTSSTSFRDTRPSVGSEYGAAAPSMPPIFTGGEPAYLKRGLINSEELDAAGLAPPADWAAAGWGGEGVGWAGPKGGMAPQVTTADAPVPPHGTPVPPQSIPVPPQGAPVPPQGPPMLPQAPPVPPHGTPESYPHPHAALVGAAPERAPVDPARGHAGRRLHLPNVAGFFSPRKGTRTSHDDKGSDAQRVSDGKSMDKNQISLPTSNANYEPTAMAAGGAAASAAPWAGRAATPSTAAPGEASAPTPSVVECVGPAEMTGWIRKKGERYGTWNSRFLVLKGSDLLILRDPSAERVKSHINMHGYKVVADENTNPGKYGFKIVHENARTHYFSLDDPNALRAWMKGMMKATIDRDNSQPVISSYSSPTITLEEARRLKPRPPSPGSRQRVQREHGRDVRDQLTTKESVLMNMSR